MGRRNQLPGLDRVIAPVMARSGCRCLPRPQGL